MKKVLKFAHGCTSLVRGRRRCFHLLCLVFALTLASLSPALADNCTYSSGGLSYGWSCVVNPKATTIINIWSPWYDEQPFIDAFIGAMRNASAEHQGFSFVLTLKSWEANATVGTMAYRDELNKALTANDASTPDVFAIGTRQLGYMRDLGLLHNLTESWTGKLNELQPTIIGTVQKLWAPEGVWYSIPIATDTMILIYNKAAFKAQNVTYPPFDISWDQLYDYAKKVNSTVTGKWGFGLTESNAYSSRIIFPLVFNATGTAKLLEGTQCAFNTSANIEAIRKFTDMWLVSKVAGPTARCNDSSTDMQREDLTSAMGGAAMMILPPGNYALLKNGFPDLGVSALPNAFLGGVGLSMGSARIYSREAAFKVILEFVKPANGFLASISLNTYNPPPIYSSSVVLAKTEPWNTTGDPHNAAFQGVNHGVDFIHPNYTLPYSNEIEEENLFRCMVAEIVEGKTTVEAAVGNLCTRVEKIVQNYGGGVSSPSPSPAPSNPASPSPATDRPAEGTKRERSLTGILVKVILGILAVLIAIFAVFFFIRCWPRKHQSKQYLLATPLDDLSDVRKFSSRELMIATENFSERNKLGEGGFGEVYAGVLPNGTPLAVKKLKDISYSHNEEFMNEVKIISAVRHRNLVGLLGYCIDGHSLMLAYELLPNGSLEDALFGDKKRVLTWHQCYEILTGTAEGISYLHTGCQQLIIHRDIKPANILLDANFRVRVSDFGMAKDTSVENTHVTTRIMGTLGYLDPSYGRTGQLTEKSDVYSFGIVIMVAMLARKPFDTEVVKSSSGSTEQMVVLSEWVQCVGEVALDKVKVHYPEDFNEEEARNCLLVAILCVQMHPETRPSMGQVVQMLKGEMAIPRVPLKDIADRIDWKTLAAESSGSGQTKGFTYDFSDLTPR